VTSGGSPGRGTETILVVDDDGTLLRLVSEILRMHGYTVIEAVDGVTPLSMIESGEPTIHAMVTDVVMPRMSGRALAEWALSLRPDMPILFMSGYVGENIEALGSLLGPKVGFVQKPFDADTVLAKLREVLDSPAAEAA
jgi:hypothetical protein